MLIGGEELHLTEGLYVRSELKNDDLALEANEPASFSNALV